MRISPTQAELDGCHAYETFVGTETIEYWWDTVTVSEYRLSVLSVVDPWRFERFEWHEIITDTDGVVSERDLTGRDGATYTEDDGTRTQWKIRVTNVTAVFIRPEPIYASISVEVRPPQAGTANGSGTYEVGKTCTVVTKERCSPWIFDRWDIAYESVTGRTKTFSFKITSGGHHNCIANYRHSSTGNLYYDSDGNGDILMCSEGILFDG